MSIPSRSPLRINGGISNSGFANTGESRWTQGGELVVTVYSGGALSPGSGFLQSGFTKAGDHVLLHAGAGRLNTITPHVTNGFTASGVALAVYDSNVCARSGPSTFMESGYRLLALVQGAQGQSGQLFTQGRILLEAPYSSGLCVAATSGVAAFSLSFTPETNPNFG